MILSSFNNFDAKVSPLVYSVSCWYDKLKALSDWPDEQSSEDDEF